MPYRPFPSSSISRWTFPAVTVHGYWLLLVTSSFLMGTAPIISAFIRHRRFLISFSHPPSGKVGRINDKLSTNRSFLIWDDSLSFFLRRYLIIQWTIGKRMNFNERSLRFIFIITIMLKYIHTCLLQIMQIQLQDINIRII